MAHYTSQRQCFNVAGFSELPNWQYKIPLATQALYPAKVLHPI
jgi:hypothetical protein